jgi:hypothetical protein
MKFVFGIQKPTPQITDATACKISIFLSIFIGLPNIFLLFTKRLVLKFNHS